MMNSFNFLIDVNSEISIDIHNTIKKCEINYLNENFDIIAGSLRKVVEKLVNHICSLERNRTYKGTLSSKIGKLKRENVIDNHFNNSLYGIIKKGNSAVHDEKESGFSFKFTRIQIDAMLEETHNILTYYFIKKMGYKVHAPSFNIDSIEEMKTNNSLPKIHKDESLPKIDFKDIGGSERELVIKYLTEEMSIKDLDGLFINLCDKYGDTFTFIKMLGLNHKWKAFSIRYGLVSLLDALESGRNKNCDYERILELISGRDFQ